MPTRQTITVTFLAVALAGLAAGCGSQGPATGSQTANNPVQAAYAFAHCMQRHGVANFPDPQVTSTPGQTSIKQVAGPSVSSSPAFRSANKACARLAPGPGNGGSAQHGGPGKGALLALARCLRAHGYGNFPDPTAQGQITGQMISASGVDIHAPGFLTTAKGCLPATHGAITTAMLEAAIHHH